jgi:hypothetical protein
MVFYASEYIATSAPTVRGDFELLRANIGAVLFSFHVTGEELEEANFTVHFRADMASDSTELGRNTRTMPCPNQ